MPVRVADGKRQAASEPPAASHPGSARQGHQQGNPPQNTGAGKETLKSCGQLSAAGKAAPASRAARRPAGAASSKVNSPPLGHEATLLLRARRGDSLGVPQAEGLDAVRCRGPADPDLLIPVSSEDVAVIGTHSLHARGEKGQAHWSGQQTWLPCSCLPSPGHLPSRVPVSSQSPSPGGFSPMTPPPLFPCIPKGPTPAPTPSPHWPLRGPGWDSSRLRLEGHRDNVRTVQGMRSDLTTAPALPTALHLSPRSSCPSRLEPPHFCVLSAPPSSTQCL